MRARGGKLRLKDPAGNFEIEESLTRGGGVNGWVSVHSGRMGSESARS